MTDKQSTLHVKIDPKGAEIGGKAAENAFERMRRAAGSSVDHIKKVSQSIGTSFINAFNGIVNSLDKFKQRVGKIFDSLKSMASQVTIAWRNTFGKLSDLLLPLGIIGTVKKVLESGLNYQKFTTTMSVITGSVDDARKQLDWLMDTANQVGVSFEAAAAPFAKFAAAAKGSIPVDEINQIFEAFAQASAALHLNRQEMQGVFLALQQMASKGRVSMEELRLQLAERIPGAMQLAARSMQMSVAELEADIRAGAVSTDEFLTDFAKEISNKFGGAANVASKSAIGAFRRFQNEIFNTSQILAHGGLLDALGNAADRIAEWLRNNRVVFKEISVQIGNIVMNFTDWITDIDKSDITNFFEGIRDTLKTTYEWIVKIKNIVPEMADKVSEIWDATSTAYNIASVPLNPMGAIVDFGMNNPFSNWVKGALGFGEDTKNAVVEPLEKVVVTAKKVQTELRTTSDIVNDLLSGKKSNELEKVLSDTEFNASINRALAKFESKAFMSALEDIQDDMRKEEERMIKNLQIARGKGPEGTRDRDFRENAASKYSASLQKLLELQIKYNEELNKQTLPIKDMEDQISLIGIEGLARENLLADIQAETDAKIAAGKVSGKDYELRMNTINSVRDLQKELNTLTAIYDYSAELDPVVNATRKLETQQEKLNLVMDAGTISTKAYNEAMRELKLELIEIQSSMGDLSFTTQIFEGMSAGLYDFSKEVTDVFSEVRSITSNALDGLADTIVRFVATGKGSFKEFAGSVIADIAKMMTKIMLMQIMCNMFPQACSIVAGVSKVAGAASSGSSTPAPRQAVGSDRIANDGLAYVHKNEAIIPAKQAESYREDKRMANRSDRKSKSDVKDRPFNIINVVDPKMIEDFMNSAAGEEIIVNTVGNNETVLNRYNQ